MTTPDKKSVMMYVMCYFQVLPHSDIVIEDEPVTGTADDKSSTSASKPNVPSQVSTLACIRQGSPGGFESQNLNDDSGDAIELETCRCITKDVATSCSVRILLM